MPLQILVVDDEPDLCTLAKEFLERPGELEIDIAYSVQEARLALSKNRYDTIVSDYQMPGEDGIQFLRSLRLSGDSTPFILFTGKGREAVVIEALNTGATFYLQKGGGGGKNVTSIYSELEQYILAAVLRGKAERSWKANCLDLNYSYEQMAPDKERDSPHLKGWSTDEIIHELKVHQIELEMQTEELRRAQLSLEESRDRYLDLYEFAPIGYLTINENEQVTESNLTGAKLLKVVRNKLIGARYSKFVAEKDSDKWQRYFKSVLNHRERQTCTLTIRREDGSEFPARLEASRISDNGEERTAVRLAISDISDIWQVEEALRQSEARYHTILDQAADAVIMNDEKGRIIDANQKACKSLGYTREELLSRYIIDIDPDAIQAGMHLRLWDGIIAGGSFTFESRHKRKDGSTIPVEETLGPVRLPNGPAILSIVRDISERRRTEKALQIANHKLNLLSGITRHDINNQTAVLEGHLAILVEAQPRLASNDHIIKAEKAVRQISALIHFTKEYEDIGVNNSQWQGIRALIETEADKIAHDPVRIVNDIPVGFEIFADPLIQKVFYNLIDNALRHGGNVTNIHFSMRESGDDHLILCEDDGVGVPAEMKEMLFRRGPGKEHGFGLFLSREILAITGITIKESGEPNRGARFEITVPKGNFQIKDNEGGDITRDGHDVR